MKNKDIIQNISVNVLTMLIPFATIYTVVRGTLTIRRRKEMLMIFDIKSIELTLKIKIAPGKNQKR